MMWAARVTQANDILTPSLFFSFEQLPYTYDPVTGDYDVLDVNVDPNNILTDDQRNFLLKVPPIFLVTIRSLTSFWYV